MIRRRLLAALGWAAFALLASGHTPYRQWKVFRQRYLLITTSRTDLQGDALGDRLVEVLRTELPDSRAMVSRAIDLERIASLITTGQTNFAILDVESARALAQGLPPFTDYGPFPLQAIVEAGPHRLVCRDDVPLHHGYLLAACLMGHAEQLGVRIPDGGDTTLPVHAGAAAFARGEAVEPPQ